MAQRNAAELLAGAVVLAVALGFLGYAVANTGRSVGGGYTLHARFDRIDGLDDRLGRAGRRRQGRQRHAARLDPQTYQAVVDFSVAPDIKLPKDSSAVISSDGLLGGKYLALEPGGDSAMVRPGGHAHADAVLDQHRAVARQVHLSRRQPRDVAEAGRERDGQPRQRRNDAAAPPSAGPPPTASRYPAATS